VSGLIEQAAAPEGSGTKKKQALPWIPLPGDRNQLLVTARKVAEAVMGRSVFFRRGEAVVFPSPTGEAKLLPLTATIFRSEIEKHAVFFKTKYNEIDDTYEEVVRSLNKSDSEGILEAPSFWSNLPEIKRVHPCPLPCLMPDGEIRMLEAGYNAETGIYTFST
jgi:hypothetical protein